MVFQNGNKDALKWTPEKVKKLVDDATSYYNECKHRTVTDIIVSQSDHNTITKQVPPNFPSIEEFQVQYDYDQYIYEIEKQYTNVYDALTRIRRIQAVFISRYGMSGLYSAPMAKMGAMNNRILKWTDKSEVDNKHELNGNLNYIDMVLGKGKNKGM